MAGGIRVDPAELQEPARRFEVAADGLDLLARLVEHAGATVSANAGHPALVAAAGGYGPGTGAALDALGDGSRLLGGKIRQAAVVYRVTDETAFAVRSDAPPGLTGTNKAV